MSADTLTALFSVGSKVSASFNGLSSQWIGSDSAGSTQRCHCYLCQASALLAPGERNLDGGGDTPWQLIPFDNVSGVQPLENRSTFTANTEAFDSSNTLDVIAGLQSPYISGLMTGGQWGDGNPDDGNTTELKYYFYTEGQQSYLSEFGKNGGYLSVDWSADEKASIVQSMQDYADVANITFTETSDRSAANVRWSNYEGASPNSFGAAYPPLGTHQAYGDIESNFTAYTSLGYSDADALAPGSFFYLTLTHELGHAIGFKHPHAQDERNGVNFDPFPGVAVGGESQGGDNDLNSTPYTVMTYNDQTSSLLSTAADGKQYDVSPGGKQLSGYLTNLGAFDIAAAQYLYGVNTSAGAGNTTYDITSNLGKGYTTIWDNGGTDEITAESASEGTVIDLRNATLKNEKGGGGYLSRIADEFSGYLIAYDATGGAVIENATGSSFADKITGNSANNSIDGGGGDDIINAGLGHDTITGGAGGDGIVFTKGASKTDVVDFNESEDKIIIPADVTPSVGTQGGDGNLYIAVDETNYINLVGKASLWAESGDTASYSFITGGEGGTGFEDDYEEEGEDTESLDFKLVSTNLSSTQLWTSGDGRVWVGSESDRQPIKDDAEYDAYYLDEDWGYGYRKPFSLVADAANYWLVLEQQHSSDEGIQFEAVQVSGTSRILDWSKSFFGGIEEVEDFVGADLNGDGETGFTLGDLAITWKENEGTPDDGGSPDPTKLGADEAGFLYIWDQTDGLIKITDEWGGDVRLDEKDEYGSGWSRESVQATWDSESEIYLIAAKETYVDTWGSEPVTNEEWLIFEVDDSGVMSWDSMKWNVNIADTLWDWLLEVTVVC